MPALTFATSTTAASPSSRLVEASVGRHSEKPSVFCEMIEIYFPTLPKIELHARGVLGRDGWDVWGLEAPSSAELWRPDVGLWQEMFDRLA
jgi:N6-adenosine-specific RNA methylase IME4